MTTNKFLVMAEREIERRGKAALKLAEGYDKPLDTLKIFSWFKQELAERLADNDGKGGLS